MPDESATEANRRIGQETQQKFDFWLVGLAFAVLGLSVQTAKFDGSGLAQASELLGWCALLAAGLFGLSRLEWTPGLFVAYANVARHERQYNQVHEAALRLRAQGAADELVRSQQDLARGEEEKGRAAAKVATDLQARLLRKYRWLRRMLALGFLLLLVARGADPAAHLICKLFSASEPAASPGSQR